MSRDVLGHSELESAMPFAAVAATPAVATAAIAATTPAVTPAAANAATAAVPIESASGSTPAFELSDVTLRYPRSKQPALKNVSLKVERNAICGLFGRNGAGKTSLMALLAAFRKPTTGTVRVFGQDPYENPMIAPQVAFIPNGSASRSDDYPSTLNVKEHLELAELSRPDWDSEFAAHLCSRFDLVHKKAISKLSLGQRAALRCVIGLAARAPLTIFDEAYLGMDAIYRRIFVDELLADYLRAPRTILFSTHYIAEMERLFSEAIIIDDGQVMLHDDADTIRSSGVSAAKAASADNAADPESASLQDVFIRLALREGEVYEPAQF
jgi:ABC-2 type transport system ATP-binding protein